MAGGKNGGMIEGILGKYRHLLHREDIEDLRQEIHLALALRLPRYDASRSSLSTYVFWIAKSAAKDFLRHRVSVRNRDAIDHAIELITSDDEEAESRTPTEGIVDPWPDQDAAVTLDLVLDRIRPRNRELLSLLRQGHSFGSVGRLWGISRERVRQLAEAAIAEAQGHVRN